MEVKERRPYCSLSRSRRERGRDWEREGDREEGEGYREGPGNRRHTGSSSVLTQKSYSSSETLKAFDQHPSTQGLYGHRMPDMVPRDTEEYRAPGQSLSLRQLGICGPAPRRGLSFCAETGLSHHTHLSGADQIQSAGGISPDCAMLWVKAHGRDSQLSSRSNSVLTLTDTEQDNRSDQENGLGLGPFESKYNDVAESGLSASQHSIKRMRSNFSAQSFSFCISPHLSRNLSSLLCKIR
uniref:Si:dkey-237h12.3 n=1 Tax=Cyprinus carpio TaxID=7962 RepID=A0A8C2CRD4_CYPCA